MRLGLIGDEAAAYHLCVSRSDIEQSALLARLHAICESVNRDAGRRIVHEESYLQPQPPLCKYLAEMKGVRYEMILLLGNSGLRVLFSACRPPMGASPRGVRRYFSGAPGTTTKLVLRINPADVTDSDFELWFAYLLSGFRRSLAPKTKALQAPRKAA